MRTTHFRLVYGQLVELEARLRGELDTELRQRFGLLVSQLEALSVIASHEPCQLRDIADRLSLTTGAAGKLVDRLETAGLCRRRPNPQAPRSVILALTPSGRGLLRDASQTIAAILRARLGSGLSPSSLRQLAAMLDALAGPAPASG